MELTLSFVCTYILQTIYYCLPLLTQVIGNELMSLDDFVRTDSFWTKQNKIPLKCDKDDILVKCRECESACVVGDVKESDSEGDVQKKIVPWSGPEALQELFPDHVIVEGGKTDLEKSIVLVSSLVNKPANLGGQFVTLHECTLMYQYSLLIHVGTDSFVYLMKV